MLVYFIFSFLVPGPVTSLNIESRSSTEVLLSWQPSYENNCREIRYVVKYQLINNDQCDESPTDWVNPNPFRVDVPITTMTMRGLLPHSSYNLSVTTRNTQGPGRSVYIVGSTGVESRYHSSSRWSHLRARTFVLIDVLTISQCIRLRRVAIIFKFSSNSISFCLYFSKRNIT